MYRKIRVLTHFVILCIEFHAASTQTKFPYGSRIAYEVDQNCFILSTRISAFSRHAGVTPAVRASVPCYRPACSNCARCCLIFQIIVQFYYVHIHAHKHTHTITCLSPSIKKFWSWKCPILVPAVFHDETSIWVLTNHKYMY